MLNEMIEFGAASSAWRSTSRKPKWASSSSAITRSARRRRGRTTGRLLNVPVGKGLLGRVVNTLGEPLDGKGPIKADAFYPVEKIAPGIITPEVGVSARADRDSGHRRDDSDRARPARIDHRRPRHRQDDDRDRHDHRAGETEQGRRSRASSRTIRRFTAFTSRSVRNNRASHGSSRRSRRPARSNTRSSWWRRLSTPPPTSISRRIPVARSVSGSWIRGWTR